MNFCCDFIFGSEGGIMNFECWKKLRTSFKKLEIILPVEVEFQWKFYEINRNF